MNRCREGRDRFEDWLVGSKLHLDRVFADNEILTFGSGLK